MAGRPGLGEQCLTDDCFLTHLLIGQICSVIQSCISLSNKHTLNPFSELSILLGHNFLQFSLGRILPPNLFCRKPSLRLKVKYALYNKVYIMGSMNHYKFRILILALVELHFLENYLFLEFSFAYGKKNRVKHYKLL